MTKTLLMKFKPRPKTMMQKDCCPLSMCFACPVQVEKQPRRRLDLAKLKGFRLKKAA